jgi:hypothetical protein
MNFLKKASGSIKKLMSSSASESQEDTLDSGPGGTFLHGTLLMSIFAAKDLPDMESWIAKIYDKGDVTDPFVDVTLGKKKNWNLFLEYSGI